MAIENWITGAEERAICLIMTGMMKHNMYLGETGGDVLRIPMSKLKKAGYKFQGCDISDDCTDIGKLSDSLEKFVMNPVDTEESLELLASAVEKVTSEMKASLPVHEQTRPKRSGIHKIYPL